MSITKILDTTSVETGATQTMSDDRQQRTGKVVHVQAEVASGDTLILEGRIDSSLSFATLYTFTTSDIVGIDLPKYYRAKRSVDGGVSDSSVWVEVFNDTA